MLKAGDKAPDFSLESDSPQNGGSGDFPPGKRLGLKELAPKGKTLVLFFYPKDSTPGCTREAQAFTENRKAIEKAGGVVVGISRDSLKSHASFRQKYGLGVTLLSDPDREAHDAYGAWGEKTLYGRKFEGTIRSTFLIRDGKVVGVFPKVKVDGHVDEVLAALAGKPAKDAAPPKTPAKADAKKTGAKKTAAKKVAASKGSTAKASSPAKKATRGRARA